MAKETSKSVVEMLECWETLVNTDELEAATYQARRRVLEIQTKLHRWARDDPHRRFDNVFNLVTDPAFVLVAWDRVRHNKGAKTAGVDGLTANYVEAVMGVEEFCDRLRAGMKDRSFRPVAVRERMIPKAGGKQRRLGIATVTDRVGPGVPDPGVGTDPGGGFPAVQLRLPSRAARSRRDRRGPAFHGPLL
jgi:retron-type reverse transcriptase